MRITTLTMSLVIALASAGSGAQMAEPAAAGRPSGAGSVEVSVEGIASGKGLVYVSIFLSAAGFPDDKSLAHANASVAAADARDGTLLLNFPAVPAGPFVVSVLHDSDGNGKLSFNLLGMPKERYGFSQNPRAWFGPPDFDAAAVRLEPGETRRLTVTLR